MVIYVYSGLTSRLYTIADAIELSNCASDGKLVVLWPIDDACCIDIREVLDVNKYKDINISFICFKTAHKSLKRIDVKKSLKKSICAFFYNIYAVNYNAIFDRETKLVKKYAAGKDTFDFNPPKEGGWSGETFRCYKKDIWKAVKKRLKIDSNIYIHAYCGIIQEDTRKNLKTLVFRQQYLNMVDSILHEKVGKGYAGPVIGLHIRRTDHQVCIAKSPLSAFIKKMEELLENNPDLKFFLATDDKGVEEDLIHRYEDKIIVQDKAWGRNSTAGMKSAILDCLCLASCTLIIGSCNSVFSHFSAEYGKVQLIEAKTTE